MGRGHLRLTCIATWGVANGFVGDLLLVFPEDKQMTTTTVTIPVDFFLVEDLHVGTSERYETYEEALTAYKALNGPLIRIIAILEEA